MGLGLALGLGAASGRGRVKVRVIRVRVRVRVRGRVPRRLAGEEKKPGGAAARVTTAGEAMMRAGVW